MTRLLIITLALTFALPASASAHRHLTIRDGRARVERAVAWDIAETSGATGHVGACWYRGHGKTRVACRIKETGITVDGLDGWTWVSVYVARVGRRGITVG